VNRCRAQQFNVHCLQEVEKNKTKDMRPLWEAAKKTVEGGISDLKALIEEKRSKVEDEQTILKLEVLERDLELISMVSNELTISHV
jgi:hypothetical protein